jgi:hypothetical protein
VATDLYCSRADVTARLPPGAITSPTGILASCLAASDILTYDGHGLETDDEVTVRAASAGTLSAPLAVSTVYYAIRLSNAAFKLAAAPGGAALNITSDGVEMIVTREPKFDDVIEFVSRWAETFLPAHLVPLTAPIHPLVRGVVADVSAKRILNANGTDSAAVNAAELAGKAILERFAAGMPLRGGTAQTPTNLAIVSTAAATDPRGWGTGLP